MKSYRIIIFAAAVLLTAACAKKASLVCTVEGAPETDLLIKTAGSTASELSDTVRTDANGKFKYSLQVQKGDPEFVYVLKDGRKLASAVVGYGDKLVIKTDTLGKYSVDGSEDSALLTEIENAYASYLSRINAEYAAGASSSDMARIYIKHYRESVKLLLSNKGSIAVIPLLFEGDKDGSPTFSQLTDAILFRSVCDTLKTLYPASRYVKTLEKETVRREGLLSLKANMDNAGEISHPALSMPSIDGKMVSLDDSGAKVIMLHFWNVSEASHKMYNLDVLKPIYEKYHPLGLEIYSVCVDPDKVAWAQTVKAQELPWVNVNDGLGTASRSLRLYNVQIVPTTLLITSDRIINNIDSESALNRELAKLLN